MDGHDRWNGMLMDRLMEMLKSWSFPSARRIARMDEQLRRLRAPRDWRPSKGRARPVPSGEAVRWGDGTASPALSSDLVVPGWFRGESPH